MWLVTGTTGHVGNVLVRRLLEHGEKVRALLLPGECRESISGLGVEAFEGDVPNLDSVFESMRGVRDVADGLISAAENGKRGESYILSGQRISVRYLLETVREIIGKNFFQMKIPFDLAKFAALFTPMYYQLANATPRFTPYSLEVLQSNSNISHEKATRELGYSPCSLYESIRDTVKWFLEKKK